MTEINQDSDEVFISGVGAPRLRRVVIEERQEKIVEHARLAASYDDDVDPHAHDQTTFRLINRRKEFDQLDGAEHVMPTLDNWDYWTKINDWDSRDRVLKDLIGKLRRRDISQAEIYLLITLCRPAWKSVAESLHRHAGADLDALADGVYQRETARRANELDRAELDSVVQDACVELLCACPNPFPRRFFGWLKNELARRALDHLRRDLTTDARKLPDDYEGVVTVLDEVLTTDGRAAGCYEVPSSPLHSTWIRTLDLPRIFDLADTYATYLRRESAVARAVDRLPARQRQVVREHYYEAFTQARIALDLGIAASTVRNNHQKALVNLERDDEMFLVLEAIGDVRDDTRRDELLLAQQQKLKLAA
jgi:RNA polymerase sigma factor (sigma-70 family)